MNAPARDQGAAPEAAPTLLFETDWLASDPVFYNEATGAASHNVNEVIDFAELEFDNEGLAAYLGTGYSLYGRTPVRHVRYLPPSARLWREADGGLRVEELPLDLERRLDERHSEDEVIDLLRARVQAAEAAAEGEIVVPTSGGYDSRLLNLMVAEPRRIRSFTFGPSERQWDSIEVTRARALAEMLGTHWEGIPIGRFHDYLDDWDDAFGPAVHAHGMYQMEFYDQVAARVAPGSLVLSGLFGDRFEGRADAFIPRVTRPTDVCKLIRTFGQRVDLSMTCVPWTGELCELYYDSRRDVLSSHAMLIVENVRFRMMLLHYLLRVPALYGLRVDAPFLDLDVATAMLTLPAERRRDRRWVTAYLRGAGVLLEDVGGDTTYWLYWPAMRRRPLSPLDAELLAEVVRPEYVRWIDRTVSWRGLWYEGYERLGQRRGFRRAYDWLGAHGLRQRRLEAYHAYMTLRPIQRLLQKRDAAQGEA